MTPTGARAAGLTEGRANRSAREADDGDRGRTAAQWYCYVFGAVLLIMGLLGFTVDSNFDTVRSDLGPGPLNGDALFDLFEVNGWHNLVHIGSGLLLLVAAPKRATAKAVAIGFGLVYVLVTLLGFIDGSDVLGWIPVNDEDNFLHAALAVTALLAGLASPAEARDRYGEPRAEPA